MKSPIATGSRTTLAVLTNKPRPSTSTRLPTIQVVSRGVHAAASIVENAVIDTESATSALARYAITLEAVPPGQQQTNTRPDGERRRQLKQDSPRPIREAA